VWDAESRAELALLRGHERAVTSVSYSPDGRRIVSGSHDDTVRVWDAESGAELAALRGHDEDVTSVSYSLDGRWIACNSAYRGPVKVLDSRSMAKLAELKPESDVLGVSAFAFSSDGKHLACADRDDIVVWDWQTETRLFRLVGHLYKIEMVGNTERLVHITSVAYSRDNQYIVSASQDGTVRVWETASGRPLECLLPSDVPLGPRSVPQHTIAVNSVCPSPDGRRIAAGYDDGAVRIWDATTFSQVVCLRGHDWAVHSVAFSPDGRTVASGSDDGTIRLWDAAATPSLLRLKDHDAEVWSMGFCRDGRHIRSSSHSGETRFWKLVGNSCLAVTHAYREDEFSRPPRRRCQWDVQSSGLEMAILEASSGIILARLPLPLQHVTPHPTAPLWAGAIRNHLYVIALEGYAPSPPIGTRQAPPDSGGNSGGDLGNGS